MEHGRTPLSFFAEPATQCHQLWTQARLLARLTDSLRESLPDTMAKHCSVANLRNGELVLCADTPAWAARLRFHTPQIKKHLLARPDVAASRIKVRSLPAPAPIATQRRRQLTLSTHNGEVLKKTARGIKDDGLQKALLKLASRAP